MYRSTNCLAVLSLLFLTSLSHFGQSSPVIVQPGAPGQPSKSLPDSTRAVMPPTSPKDVEFMQGMIMHHAQAVEMSDLIAGRSQNGDVIRLGARIRQTQLDEMQFMRQWLMVRGEKMTMEHSAPIDSHAGHGHGGHSHAGQTPAAETKDHTMPGMLTPAQMKELREAKGEKFDHLFLTGMIQHHDGALAMVEDLFNTPGAGQESVMFNFATDVDNSQRAEIKIMQTLLAAKPYTPEEE